MWSFTQFLSKSIQPPVHTMTQFWTISSCFWSHRCLPLCYLSLLSKPQLISKLICFLWSHYTPCPLCRFERSSQKNRLVCSWSGQILWVALWSEWTHENSSWGTLEPWWTTKIRSGSKSMMEQMREGSFLVLRPFSPHWVRGIFLKFKSKNLITPPLDTTSLSVEFS